MDWKIGSVADDSDNTANSTDLILTIEELTYADDILAAGNVTVTNAYELSTTLVQYGSSAANTDTTNTIYPEEARDDVRAREASNEGTITTASAAAVEFSRVHWL